MVLWLLAMHKLSVGGPVCSYHNDYARGRRTKIQPNPNYKTDPQHSAPQDNNRPLPMTSRPVSGRASVDVNSQSCDCEVGRLQGVGLKVSMPQSSELLVSILGRWTTIKIELCTAVSAILERLQLAPSSKTPRSKFPEL
ncbi:uncharacterized protein EAF01_000380 [Botrytis porri]|uniref:Uncharacterized protein n=1 Tax=Botrytis porri TaxID=87229 RepID=A0A4Z1KL79_9HELO|nr:uncharacterized protein EAF01_000380 [Botrytis porri]KAF7913974.1 hypothetical protein EAF01_000380 [Botrytis porri]TGO86813.1 hypothetical protein BPOR_0274g00040 [Botrytis porri]